VRFDPLNILLVDDNDHMRLLLTEMLRAIGVRHIFEALNGMEALSMMKRAPIDIVITDLKMDALSGIEFVSLLRRSPDSPNPFVPVIMITGHSTTRRVRDARDAGVNEFLTKPVTGRSLVHRLTQVIDQPRAYVRCDDYFGPDRRRRAAPNHKGPWRRDADAISL
jgi:CheY-like chemotaxis protein